MSDPRACILSVAGQTLTPDEARLLSRANPWGVILMGRSCGTPQQVKALTDAIQQATGRSTLMFIDQEGGRVRRLRPPNWPDFPAAGAYAAVYEADRAKGLEAVWLGHRLMAAELKAIGIHADCAPVVDLVHAGAHQIVGDRAFGAGPEQAGVLAAEALRGLSEGGVAGVIKHIPGHGRALADSHQSLPVVHAGMNELMSDIAAFSAVNHASMAMTAHVAYTTLDGETPATLSATIIADIIRKRIGFNGLLMTDDLGMNALGGSLTQRGERAFAAGVDVLLHCAGFIKAADDILREMEEVADVSPELSSESLKRSHMAERATLNYRPFDRTQGWARFRELMGSARIA